MTRVGRAAESLSPGEPTPGPGKTFRRSPPGVVAFRIHVRAARSRFEPSQDIDAESYARVRDDLAAGHPGLADLMGNS
ncbi:hypothetical protein [Nonomuraea sp. NPDC002799]